MDTLTTVLNRINRALLIALAVAFLGTSPTLAQLSAPFNALVIVRATQMAEMDQAVAFIRVHGAQVPVTMSPSALFVDLPAGDTSAWIGKASIAEIITAQADATMIETQYGESAGLGARVWNQIMFPPTRAPTPSVPGSNALNDAHIPPDYSVPSRAPSAPLAPPSNTQTSEFLYGSVQVDMFLPESNGTIDTNAENWTTTMRDNVASQVTTGVNWWVSTATQGGKPSANLTINVSVHDPFNEPSIVATGYEPINRSSPTWSSSLWIGDIMTHLGYAASGSGVRSYANARRVATGRNWAFVIFIANDNNGYGTNRGYFADGYFAYAYVNGPFMVMTYHNDNWGISRMQMVTAHEMGHIFGADDEYAASGCSPSDTSGYLNIANTNCENGTSTENSIMRDANSQLVAYPSYLASTPARGMVGWRDSNCNGVYDVADTTVSLSASRTSGGTLGQPATFSGTATDIPYPSPSHSSISVNIITTAQYRVDGGSWLNATPSDGAFNAYSEGFNVTTVPLAAGMRVIDIRAINSAGNSTMVSSDFCIGGCGIFLPMVKK